jgi:hypothetical protein
MFLDQYKYHLFVAVRRVKSNGSRFNVNYCIIQGKKVHGFLMSTRRDLKLDQMCNLASSGE